MRLERHAEGRHRRVQLDTYGSADRKLAQKVSQSIQLDREGALELLRIMETAFPKP